MALPIDLIIREYRFRVANPQWFIYSHDNDSWFDAKYVDGTTRHIVARDTLGKLLDRLDVITGGENDK